MVAHDDFDGFSRLRQGDMFGHNAYSEGLTAGIDEAGRGPLAGAVYAAAVILDPDRPIEGLADSKTLKPTDRQRLALQIQARAVAWSIARAEVHEIDSINILQATFLAMQRAMQGLAVRPLLALIDGNQAPKLKGCAVQTVVKGDTCVPAISAASILAKTARDANLLQLHAQYPAYGFDQHKGYGTVLHLARLREHGPCPAHRRSFAPVRMLMQAGSAGARSPATERPACFDSA
jgi:ribonuclease HII